MIRVKTEVSQSYLPPDASVERRLDAITNRRALMVYAANILPEFSAHEAAAAGLPVNDASRFLSQQRERYTLASIVRQAHKGEEGLDLPTAWIPEATKAWERVAEEIDGMQDFQDGLLTDSATQSETYLRVINWRVHNSDEEGAHHFDYMPANELVDRFLDGAVAMPGLDNAREVNVPTLVSLMQKRSAEEADLQQAV